MKKIILIAVVAMMAVPSYGTDIKAISLESQNPASKELSDDESGAENGYDGLDSGFTLDNKSEIIANNEKFWNGGKTIISVGWSNGSFDRGLYYGGMLTSRWGVGIKSGKNIMFHRKPIAHLLKFGLFFGGNASYYNFEKGEGKFSDIFNGSGEGDMSASLGTHYLTAGIAIGPTVTVMPFYWCSNANVARIKIRPYFHVVPSYCALILSNDSDMEVNGAITCLYAGGAELIWRKLSIGLEWKGGRARYKDLVGDLFDFEGVNDLWIGAGDVKQPRMGCKMFTVSLGLTF